MRSRDTVRRLDRPAAANVVCRFTGLSRTPRCTVTGLVRWCFPSTLSHITDLHQRCLFNCAHPVLEDTAIARGGAFARDVARGVDARRVRNLYRFAVRPTVMVYGKACGYRKHRTPLRRLRLRSFSARLPSCRPSSPRCSTRSGSWSAHAPRCTWRSSRSDTSSRSSIGPAAHVSASRRPTGCCGRGAHGYGAAGVRPFTSSSRKPSSRGTGAAFVCSGRGSGRADTASAAQPFHTTFAP